MSDQPEQPEHTLVTGGTAEKPLFGPPLTNAAVQAVPSAPAPLAPAVALDATPAPRPDPQQALQVQLSETFSTHETQPDKLPSEAEASFRSGLNLIRENFKSPDLVAQQLRSLMISMHQAPQLAEFLAPEDIGVMIQGVRTAYGKAVTTKKETSRGKKKQPGADVVESMAGLEELLAGVKI